METPLELLNLTRPLIDAALAEDVGTGDATAMSTIAAGTQGRAEILVKESGVVCGLLVARDVFARVDAGLSFEADAVDGEPVVPGTTVARIRGEARSILTAERTALNFMQHLSGIATAASRATAILAGTGTRILDTRKTLPGLRHLAKYAVRCGGGANHRMGLYDMILIKENHIAAAGGISVAVTRARKQYPGLAVEVEVTNQAELEEALASTPERIMLDNFDPSGVKAALVTVESWAANGNGKTRPQVELSGGITLETLRSYALPGVDFISSGALTHSVTALDISLELELAPPAVPSPPVEEDSR